MEICPKTWEILLQRCLLLGTKSQIFAQSQQQIHLSLSSLPRVGRHPQLLDTWSLPPKFGLCLTTALSKPEEEQTGLGGPLVRDGQKYLFKEQEIQILQSQMVPPKTIN